MKGISTVKYALHTAVLLTLVPTANSVSAQQLTATRRIADLNPGSVGSEPRNPRVFGQRLYFSASTPGTGRELWSYDGTNFSLLADINNTAANDSTPEWLTPFGGSLFFSAFDQKRGGELWRYNGTDTVRVTDINPDANDSIKTTPKNSWPKELTEFNNALYFSADSGPTKFNFELWKYDGTSATQVRDINLATSGSDLSSYPNGLTVFNGGLYFMADDGSNGYELWKATSAGATLFASLNSGSADSFPKSFTPFNGELYFQALNSANGYELWKTNGSSPPVRIDLVAGSGSSFPEFFAVFNGALYFRANIGSTGSELWKYDGTTATLASNIHPTGDSFPKNLTVFKDHLYFAANDGVNGWELWKFNGVSSSLVSNLNPSGDSFPEKLVVHNDNLYFVATTPATGYELWKYDGTTVTLTADPNPGPGDSFPRVPTAFNNELFFSASNDGVVDWEPWGDISVPFRVTTIERVGNDIRLVWTTLGGTTNIVKASNGGVVGPYSNLGTPIVVPGVSATTAEYLDVGGAALGSRFYRIVKP